MTLSDFDGDGIVYRFEADIGGSQPYLIIRADAGNMEAVITLGPADLGNFAGAIESARKELLKLWVHRDDQ